MFISNKLTIKNSPKKGRGVFATQNIKANTVIEISPVLVFDKDDAKHLEKTLLYNYVFEWGNDKKSRALALGFVSMYNHNYTANCIYEMDYTKKVISITTVADIKAGQELFINYNGTPIDTTPVWFHQ